VVVVVDVLLACGLYLRRRGTHRAHVKCDTSRFHRRASEVGVTIGVGSACRSQQSNQLASVAAEQPEMESLETSHRISTSQGDDKPSDEVSKI